MKACRKTHWEQVHDVHVYSTDMQGEAQKTSEPFNLVAKIQMKDQ